MKEQRLRMKEDNFEKKNKKYKANPSYQTLELVKLFEFIFFFWNNRANKIYIDGVGVGNLLREIGSWDYEG